MGFMDGFTSDGTVDMKHTEYYNLMKEAAKAELLSNAVKAEVPGFYIQAMITGKKPEFLSELKADCWSCRTCGNTKPVSMDVDKCRECKDGSQYTEADTPDEKSHEMESEEESEEPDNGNE